MMSCPMRVENCFGCYKTFSLLIFCTSFSSFTFTPFFTPLRKLSFAKASNVSSTRLGKKQTVISSDNHVAKGIEINPTRSLLFDVGRNPLRFRVIKSVGFSILAALFKDG